MLIRQKFHLRRLIIAIIFLVELLTNLIFISSANAWTGAYSKVSALSGPMLNDINNTDVQKATDVVALPDGSRIVVGTFQNSIDMDPSTGTYNLNETNDGESLFIGKYDIFGELVWAKYFGSRISGAQLAIDSQLNIYVSGAFTGSSDFDPGVSNYIVTSNGSTDRFVVKLTQEGNFTWAISQGNSLEDDAAQIVIDGDDNIYLGGTFNGGSADFDPSASSFVLNIPKAYTGGSAGVDSFILKLDSSGAFQWVVSGFSNWGWDDVFTGIDVDVTGNIYLSGWYRQAGCYSTGCGTEKGFARKFDSSGNLTWNLEIKNSYAQDQIPRTITVDSSENVFVTGDFVGTVTFNPLGTSGTLTASGRDIFVLKLNSLGNFVWVRRIDTAGNSVDAIQHVGNLYLTGAFGSNAIFDPEHTPTKILAKGTAYEGFVAKFDSNGNLGFAYPLNSTNGSSIAAISNSNNGGVVMVGSFTGATDFGVSDQSKELLSPQGTSDGFFWEVSNAGSSDQDLSLVPVFSEPTSTTDGFDVNVTNYDADYSFTASISVGQVSVGEPEGTTLPVTVSGLNVGQEATLSITSSRHNYKSIISRITGKSIMGSALVPTFNTPTRTSNGFTVNINNYDNNYLYSVSSNAGTVSKGAGSGTNLPLTVTGLSAGQSATISVLVTRVGYHNGLDSISSNALNAALAVNFSTPIRTSDGYTVNVTNYDSNYSYVVNSNVGTATKGTASASNLTITVTGLSAGQSATTTVVVSRTGYSDGSGSISSTAINAALVPTFGAATPKSNGFTLQISNYNVGYTWTGTNSLGGTTTISTLGLITVTGINPGTSSTVTITTSRSGYNSGSATSSSITSVTGAALTPAFGSATRTTDGFTVQISNYNASFNWTVRNSRSGTTTISNTGLITVTGLAPGVASTVTVTSTRTGYNTGSATSSSISSMNGVALVPLFDNATSTADGFTLEISNYDSNYVWSVRNSLNAATTIGNTGLITVTGMAPGTSSTVTVTTTRTGYNTGSATSSSVSSIIGAALTPVFGPATSTADGFTVQINNFDANYTYGKSATASGSVLINGSGFVTVSGVAPSTSSTLTITTTRTGYESGSANVSATSLRGSALNPTFGSLSRRADGFTVQISNFDPRYTYAGSATESGSVEINGTGLVTVTGVSPATTSTVTITTTRAGCDSGTAAISGTSLTGAALTPTFGSITQTANGFTVHMSNFDFNYTYAGTATSSGSVAISGSGLVVVTGVTPATSSTATITTARTGYASGSATITGRSLNAALIPIFGSVTPTTDGFTATIVNFNSLQYEWDVTVDNGNVYLNANTGVITVTGVTSGESATATVTSSRSGYASGSATVSASTLDGSALTPTFGTPRATADGFTVTITNFNNSFNWNATTTRGIVAINTGTGVITVTGVAAGLSATVTVSTTRSGFPRGTATISATSLNGDALVPVFSTPRSTVDGFTSTITNFSNSYRWTLTTTTGRVALNLGTGVVTVSGVAVGASATVTANTTRTGYANGSATVTASSLNGAALTPRFSTAKATANGFTVTVTNFSRAYSWSLSATSGDAVINTSTGVITVSGLTSGAAATVTVTATRTGYATGSSTVSASALSVYSISTANASPSSANVIVGYTRGPQTRVTLVRAGGTGANPSVTISVSAGTWKVVYGSRTTGVSSTITSSTPLTITLSGTSGYFTLTLNPGSPSGSYSASVDSTTPMTYTVNVN